MPSVTVDGESNSPSGSRKISEKNRMEPRPTRRAIRWGIVTVGVPALFSGLIYGLLLLQPHDTWRRLAPAADFPRARLDLKVIVLLKEDTHGDLMPLHESQYFYRRGAAAYLVPVERVKVLLRGGADGWSEAYAVDPSGAFYRFRSPGGSGDVEFKALPGVPQEVELLSAHALIVSEDRPTLTTFESRIPTLLAGKQIVLMSDHHSPDGVRDDHLSWLVWLRIAVISSTVLSAWLLIWSLTPSLGPFRPVVSLMAFPVLLVSGLWLATTVSGFSSVFGVLPYLMWGVVLSASFWTVLKREVPFPRWTELARNPALNLGRGLSALLLAVFFFLLILSWNQDLTMGDSVKFVRGALYIYDHDRWPLDAVVSDLGPDSLIANYPPGISMCIAAAMWVVGPDPARMIFPGRLTGSVFLLYGAFLASLNFCFLLAVALYVKAVSPLKWMALLAIASVCLSMLYVPTAMGRFHAGESLVWPLFCLALISGLTWRATRSSVAGLFTLLMMFGLCLLKQEGVIYALLLIVPWLFQPLRSLWRSRRESFVRAVSLAVISLLLSLPLLALNFQKRNLGVFSPAYRWPVDGSMVKLLKEYLRIVYVTLQVGLSTRGQIWAPLPLLPVGAMILVGILSRRKHGRVYEPTVLIGTGLFLIIFPVTYVFSTWSPIALHIDVSWGRLCVPVSFNAGLYALHGGLHLLQRPGEAPLHMTGLTAAVSPSDA